MLEYLIPFSCISDVVRQLGANGRNSAFAILIFDPRGVLLHPAGPISLQYSIENDTIGLDWVLVGPSNIADKDQVANFIRSRGHKLEKREGRDVSYLPIEDRGIPYVRVEDGDLTNLGRGIWTDFYHQDGNRMVWLVVDKFDYHPSHDYSGGIAFVRSIGSQPEHTVEVRQPMSLFERMESMFCLPTRLRRMEGTDSGQRSHQPRRFKRRRG